jgi:hypothetical protein
MERLKEASYEFLSRDDVEAIVRELASGRMRDVAVASMGNPIETTKRQSDG